MGHRMSALPIAQYCGMAPKLSLGAGRAAAQSTAFHAMCAKAENAADLFRNLTISEQKELLTWKRPADIVLSSDDNPVVLRYEDAEHELAVALDTQGMPCSPESPNVLTVGHLDMGWVKVVGGVSIAYVGDIKRTPWTTTDGTESLQLVAYGLAYALLRGCEYFACGIWQATEAQWQWGDTIDLLSLKASELSQRVRAAAANDSSDYNTGPHCRGCYQRLNCPAHALRAAEGIDLARDELAPLVGGLTADNALSVLLSIQAAEEVVATAKKTLQVWVERNGWIRSESKVYRPVMTTGRATLDEEALEKDMPGLLERYRRPGAPYPQFRWTNDPALKKGKKS
jgi:hypothetical protein